jgi:peptidoglycan/LPS O-acetylase OafA/YrhL
LGILGFSRCTNPLKRIVPIGLCILVFELAARVGHELINPRYTDRTHLFATHLRLDSLFFGVLLSYAFHFHRGWLWSTVAPVRRLLVPIGISLLLPAFVYPLETPAIFTVGLTSFYLGSGMLVLAAIVSPLRSNWITTPIAALGTASYSTYLWHGVVILWGLPLASRLIGRPIDYEARLVLTIVASMIVGLVMARIVEAPMLKLRNHWFPSRADGPKPDSVPARFSDVATGPQAVAT